MTVSENLTIHINNRYAQLKKGLSQITPQNEGRNIVCTSNWNCDTYGHKRNTSIFMLRSLFHGAPAPSRPGPPHYRSFTITLGRTPLEEWSVRRKDLYLTTHNPHKRQTSMPPGGIRTHNPSKWMTEDPHLKPRGHCDRHVMQLVMPVYVVMLQHGTKTSVLVTNIK
jgi:hypothetical protein